MLPAGTVLTLTEPEVVAVPVPVATPGMPVAVTEGLPVAPGVTAVPGVAADAGWAPGP